MSKLILLGLFITVLTSCSNQPKKKSSEKADMYEASEVSATMRTMVEFSKQAKKSLSEGQSVDSIPAVIWDLASATATRDEHKDEEFQTMVKPYLSALRGIERGDSQSYYYHKSIDACKTCHAVYCGGPMAIINQLD